MAGEVHGSKALLKIQNASGTLTTVDGGSSSSLQEAIETADTTQFSDTAHNYIPGLEDADVSMEGSWTPTNCVLIRGVKRMVRTFEYYPAGNTSGLEKLSGSLIITTFSRASGIDGKATMSIAAKITGGVTAATI